MKINNYLKLDIFTIFFIITVLLYLYLAKITFDCDSLYYFNNHNLQQDIPYRGILYTFILGLMGIGTIYNSFFVYLLFQAFFAIVAFYFLNKLISYNSANKFLYFVINFIIIISFQIVTYMKVILPHQLMLVTIILILFFFYKFLQNKHFNKLITFTLIFLLILSINIRAESIIFLLVIISIIFIKDIYNRNLNNILYKLSFILISYLLVIFIKINMIFFSYLFFNSPLDLSKSYESKSSWSGKTMFIQFYQLKNEKAYSMYNLIKNTKKNKDHIFIKPSNGENSTILYNHVKDFFSAKKNYIYLKKILVPSSLVINSEEIDWWNKLFESKNFDGHIIAESFFNEPNQILFDNTWRYIDKKIGKKEGDRLFYLVSLEAFQKHPEILFAVADNFFWYFGISLNNTMENFLKHNEYKISFRSWTFDTNLRDSFNAGNCASKLPKSMFLEYKNSHYKFNGYDETGKIPYKKNNFLNIEDKILYSFDQIKEYIYICISIVFLLLILHSLIFFKFNVFTFSIFIMLIGYNLILSISTDSMTKFENISFILMIIFISQKLRRRKND